jgi:hypothetical protein
MRKIREMSEGAQGLIVSLSLGVVAIAVAWGIKLLYDLL